MRVIVGIVLACFVLAAALHGLWQSGAPVYAAALAWAGEGCILLVQPVAIIDGLITDGTVILTESALLDEPLGSFETWSISFYLPFIVLLLTGSAVILKTVSPADILLLLVLLIATHVSCVVLAILLGQAAFLELAGAPVMGSFERSAVSGLLNAYTVYGAQMWSGLTVALLLGRSALHDRSLDNEPVRFLVSTRGIAVVSSIILMPSILYLTVAPFIWEISGSTLPARLKLAEVRAQNGDIDTAAGMAREILASDEASTGAMLLLAKLAAGKNPGESAKLARSILEIEPDHREANLLMGALLARWGDLEGSTGHYETVLADKPANTEALSALLHLARAYDREGNACAAEKLYSRGMPLIQEPDQRAVLQQLHHEAERICTRPGEVTP